jgi:hypothetical protein
MAGGEERLALIEVIERDGRVRQQYDVRRWPVAIGRSLESDVVLDDPHVAARHARIAPDEVGRLWLEVGDTRNGVRVGRRTLAAGERLALEAAPSDAWHLGHTRLRVRLAGEPALPERPLVAPAGVGITLVASVLLWLLFLAERWIETDPDAGLNVWLPVVIGPPLAMVVWCAVWALASKLFQHRFEFAAHWALAVRWLLVLMLGSTLITQGAAALALPGLFRLAGPYEAAALAVGVFLHARLVLASQARALAVSILAAYGIGAAVLVALNHQREQPWVGPLYMHALPLAHWRVARPEAPDAFTARARDLKATLDARARAEPDEADTPVIDTEPE